MLKSTQGDTVVFFISNRRSPTLLRKSERGIKGYGSERLQQDQEALRLAWWFAKMNANQHFVRCCLVTLYKQRIRWTLAVSATFAFALITNVNVIALQINLEAASNSSVQLRSLSLGVYLCFRQPFNLALFWQTSAYIRQTRIITNGLCLSHHHISEPSIAVNLTLPCCSASISLITHIYQCGHQTLP